MLFVGLLAEQQPTEFELSPDPKAAKAVGLTITAAFPALAAVID
jgi:hypothetical protein